MTGELFEAGRAAGRIASGRDARSPRGEHATGPARLYQVCLNCGGLLDADGFCGYCDDDLGCLCGEYADDGSVAYCPIHGWEA